MISNTKINNLFQIKNLVIFSVILGGIKLIEQLIKGKYFHDFDVYLNAMNVLNNSGNPYYNIWELPYLYPPIISKLLEISNQSLFGIIYSITYISTIFLVYIISEKNYQSNSSTGNLFKYFKINENKVKLIILLIFTIYLIKTSINLFFKL